MWEDCSMEWVMMNNSISLVFVILKEFFLFIGLLLPAVAMTGLAYVQCDKPYLGVALLTIGLAFT